MIPEFELAAGEDGKETLRIFKISHDLADNLAWRIARAIAEIPKEGRSFGRLQRELKRQHIDLIPRFKDGTDYPVGLVFGVKGMGVSGSAISAELTPKKMHEAGFRIADTDQELEALQRAHVGFNEYAVGEPKPGRDGQAGTIGISKQYKGRRDAVIRQSLTGGLKLDPDSVWIMKMMEFGSDWRNPVHHAEDHTKVYKDQGDGSYRRFNFGGKTLGIVERQVISDETDILTIASDLEMGFAVNGDPTVNSSVGYAPRTLRRTKRFSGFVPPKNPQPPRPNDLAVLPQELRERVENGDIEVEILTNRPPGIASARRSWLHFDIDNVELPEGFDPVLRPSEAADHIVRTMLPPEFHGARFGIQLSSSAGMAVDKDDKDDAGGVRATRDSHSRSASMHLFVEVEKPVFPEDVKAWLEQWEAETGREGALDLQIFEPNQVNYLMPPVFDTVDPYADRRHSVLQGFRKVRLPDHVDGMAINAEVERFYSPFRRQAVERSDREPIQAQAQPRPRGQGVSNSRNWKIAAGPLPQGGGECRPYLAKSVQAMAHSALEENPLATTSDINAIRYAISDRAGEMWDDLYDKERMSARTYESNHYDARLKLIDGALDEASARHLIPSFSALKKLPDGQVKAEHVRKYISALKKLDPNAPVVVDPRDEVPVLMTPVPSGTVIRGDGEILSEKSVVAWVGKAHPGAEIRVVRGLEGLQAAVEQGVPAIGVFGASPSSAAVQKALSAVNPEDGFGGAFGDKKSAVLRVDRTAEKDLDLIKLLQSSGLEIQPPHLTPLKPKRETFSSPFEKCRQVGGMDI